MGSTARDIWLSARLRIKGIIRDHIADAGKKVEAAAVEGHYMMLPLVCGLTGLIAVAFWVGLACGWAM